MEKKKNQKISSSENFDLRFFILKQHHGKTLYYEYATYALILSQMGASIKRYFKKTLISLQVEVLLLTLLPLWLHFQVLMSFKHQDKGENEIDSIIRK